jgi:hypothetical protein
MQRSKPATRLYLDHLHEDKFYVLFLCLDERDYMLIEGLVHSSPLMSVKRITHLVVLNMAVKD